MTAENYFEKMDLHTLKVWKRGYERALEETKRRGTCEHMVEAWKRGLDIVNGEIAKKGGLAPKKDRHPVTMEALDGE